jgi:hypothetical protein
MTLPSHRRLPARLALLAAAPLLVSTLTAQISTGSTLPPTPPTALPPANALPAPIAATPAGASTRAHRAKVSFDNGQLDVRADNSSLNQILHEISNQTGMKITGGVADQRVFGNYGPATPSDVLATLLDGTGTNMLVRSDPATDAPVELVLTPRGGGASPPNPNAQSYDDDDQPPTSPRSFGHVFPALPMQHPPQRPAAQPAQPSVVTPATTLPATTQPAPVSAVPPQIPQPLNNPLGDPRNTTPTASQIPTTNSVPTDSLPQPSTAVEPPQGIVDTPNPPPAHSTTGTSPNGVKTPQQIYQELLQLQQQQNQTNTNGGTSTAPAATAPATTTPPQ